MAVGGPSDTTRSRSRERLRLTAPVASDATLWPMADQGTFVSSPPPPSPPPHVPAAPAPAPQATPSKERRKMKPGPPVLAEPGAGPCDQCAPALDARTSSPASRGPARRAARGRAENWRDVLLVTPVNVGAPPASVPGPAPGPAPPGIEAGFAIPPGRTLAHLAGSSAPLHWWCGAAANCTAGGTRQSRSPSCRRTLSFKNVTSWPTASAAICGESET